MCLSLSCARWKDICAVSVRCAMSLFYWNKPVERTSALALMWFSHVCSCQASVSASLPLFDVCVYWFVCLLHRTFEVLFVSPVLNCPEHCLHLGLPRRAKRMRFVCLLLSRRKKQKLNLCMLYGMRCVNLSNGNARFLLALSIFVTVASAWQIVIYSFVQDVRPEDFCELIKINSMTVLYGTVSFRSKQMPATQYKLLEWWMQSINFTCRDEIDCTRRKVTSEMLNEKLADGKSEALRK